MILHAFSKLKSAHLKIEETLSLQIMYRLWHVMTHHLRQIKYITYIGRHYASNGKEYPSNSVTYRTSIKGLTTDRFKKGEIDVT